MSEKIDFVILWVDGNDVEWQNEKRKYDVENDNNNESNSNIRYRDYGLLKYWFRSIEANTPWVNKIYFVTCGQKPEWLDENNEKLVLINHKDFIPNSFLPTFNSNVIDLFLNRISGLSEQFVYFNDDTFIVGEMKEEDFFQNGIPKDYFSLNAVSIKPGGSNIIEHTVLNNLEIVSNHFDKKDVIKQNKSKIFNVKYGKQIIKSLLLMPWKFYTGIENPHIPFPLLKSTMDKVWDLEYDKLIKIGNARFRTKNDYNIWLFRYWQLCSGKFIPISTKSDFYYEMKNNNQSFIKDMINKKYKRVCINDSNENLDFEIVKKEFADAFEKMYPNKSSFEK